MSLPVSGNALSCMAVSFLLCNDAPPVAQSPSPVKTVARINHGESRKFFYAIGKAFDEEPNISEVRLLQQVKEIASRQQLYPILEDMVDQGFLLKTGCKFGYEPTLKLLQMQDQLLEWSQLEFNENRATVTLVDSNEQKMYFDRILEQFATNQQSLGLKDVSDSIQGINQVQVLHLLKKLTKQGRLIQAQDSMRRLWSLNQEFVAPEEPQLAAVKVPKLQKAASAFTSSILHKVYQQPGIQNSALKELEGYTQAKLVHSLRKLQNLQLVKKAIHGRTVSWYPIRVEIPAPTVIRELPRRDVGENELSAVEFQAKVIEEVRKHPFIMTNKLYASVNCRAKFPAFRDSLLKLEALTGHQHFDTYFWSIKNEEPEIDALDLSITHKRILRHVKSDPGIMRVDLKKAMSIPEGNLSRALQLLLHCQLIHKKKSTNSVHFYDGPPEEDYDGSSEESTSS